MAKIYRVIQITLNQLVYKKVHMITDLPTWRIKRYHSDKQFSEFLPTRWRQQSTGMDIGQNNVTVNLCIVLYRVATSSGVVMYVMLHNALPYRCHAELTSRRRPRLKFSRRTVSVDARRVLVGLLEMNAALRPSLQRLPLSTWFTQLNVTPCSLAATVTHSSFQVRIQLVAWAAPAFCDCGGSVGAEARA